MEGRGISPNSVSTQILFNFVISNFQHVSQNIHSRASAADYDFDSRRATINGDRVTSFNRFVTAKQNLWPSLGSLSYSSMTNLSIAISLLSEIYTDTAVKMKTCVNIKVIIFWSNIIFPILAEFHEERNPTRHVSRTRFFREFGMCPYCRTKFEHLSSPSFVVYVWRTISIVYGVRRIIDSTGLPAICVWLMAEFIDSRRLTHFRWK